MIKLFGTDGIRGTPGEYPLTDAMLSKIAKAISVFISKKHTGVLVSRCLGVPKVSTVIIGKDTRLSGPKIEIILAKTFSSQGISILLAGIITTPGLSYLVRENKADMGIMISASHNKPTDNGIKFFNSKGHKLSLEDEEKIEKILLQIEAKGLPKSKTKGKARNLKDVHTKYIRFLLSTVKGLDLKGMRIALDCAWGSAALFAKEIFKELKAEVHAIHDKPKGTHINIGGAIEPRIIKDLVLKTKAHIGIALDGDCDRGILLDEKGNIVDGDHILAIMANYLNENKKLTQNTLVTTVMANYGLKVCLDKIGCKMIMTPVGDKHVLDSIVKNKLNLGGEQSGHIIFYDHLPTPDGLLTALQILKVMKDTNCKLSELSQCMAKFPQILVNIKVKEKRPFEHLPGLEERLKHCNAKLKDKGRILLRYSGTELLARVMVEGMSHALIEDIANSLAEHIRQEIGV